VVVSRVGIDEQHAEVAALRSAHPESIVIPFAAVDPRRDGIVETTIALIEQHDVRGLKLYPPTGYHLPIIASGPSPTTPNRTTCRY